ncbi:MAG: YqgE/AlgH family protein [Planctomycetota bacterium]
MDSLRGKLLLASPAMGDPNFERAVILMVQHGEEGALGLVLNRPTDTSLAEAMASLPGVECGIDGPLHRGGPCDGPLMALHRDTVGGEERVMDGVCWSTQREYVEPVLAGAAGPAVFFAGYAGWGAGQLEGELQADAWVVTDTDGDTVLTPGEGEGWWLGLIRRQRRDTLGQRFDPKIVPPDPSMN